MYSSASSQAPTTTPDLVCVLVVLVQPSTATDQRRYDELQTLRRAHDQAFDRWLPHITLIPPFTLSSTHAMTPPDQPLLPGLTQLHAAKLSEIARTASNVCAKHNPHSLLLDQVSTFPLRSYTNVHLRPFPTNFHDRRTTTPRTNAHHSSHQIVQLQKELDTALTPLLDAKRRREVWKPHVSVGQSTGAKAAWQLCTAAESLLQKDGGEGLLCDVDRVQLMLKPKGQEGPYHIHMELVLSK